MKLTRIFALGLLGLALLANVASASLVPLAPGSSVTLTPEPSSADWTGATRLAAKTLTLPDNGNGVMATVWEAVVRNSLNTLDFVYQVRNDSTAGIIQASMSGTAFSTFTTSVGSVSDVPNGSPINLVGVGFRPTNTQNPSDAARTAGVGASVSFDGFSIAPGNIAGLMVIRTNAATYNDFGTVTVSSSDTGTGATTALRSFQPATVVPEPATLGAALVGLVGFGLVARARRKRA